MTRLFFLMCGTLLLASAHVIAQGTRDDYARANSLAQRVTGKTVRASVKPNWIGQTGRFWYSNDLGEGRHEFLVVDPAAPSRRPAFNSARMAAALTKTLGKKVDAAHLPIDTIAFAEDKLVLTILTGGKTYVCDLQTYELHEKSKAIPQATGLALEDAPKASRSGGEETTLTFVNHTGGDVVLNWLDEGGQRHDYGAVKAGAQRDMHTYAGHAWLVTAKEGKPLGVWMAQSLPDRAILDGTPLTPRPNSTPSLRPILQFPLTVNGVRLRVVTTLCFKKRRANRRYR